MTKILLISLVLGISVHSKAQLLTNTSNYRNQVFLNGGYYLSFGNYSIGWFHNEHVKFLKRDITSILDFSFPISHNFYTRFVLRKGLQTNIWQNDTWRLPVAIIGSSDKVITSIFRIHDFVTDLFLNPGIYKKKYTLALDLDYKVIWFSHYRRTSSIDHSTAPKNMKIHEKFAVGVAAGLNHNRFTYLLKTGYQQTADIEKRPYTFYGILQIGYNFNFKKSKNNSTAAAEANK